MITSLSIVQCVQHQFKALKETYTIARAIENSLKKTIRNYVALIHWSIFISFDAINLRCNAVVVCFDRNVWIEG